MIVNETIKVKWNGKNKEHYIEKGYIFTKYGDKFEINTTDLPHGSEKLIEYVCDYCNGKNQKEDKDKFKQYKVLIRCRKLSNKDCCKHKDCKYTKLSEEISLKSLKPENKLGNKKSELLVEWDFDKNKLTPNSYSYDSNAVVWWKCNKGHEWEKSIKSRAINNSKCPICFPKVDNRLLTISPEIAKQWHPTKNKEIDLNIIENGSNKKVWWLGECGHEWDAQVKSRTILGSNCPFCKNNKIPIEKSLATKYPELAKEWHSIKNMDLTAYDVKPLSKTNVWWICEKGHEWEDTVKNRVNNKFCPECKYHPNFNESLLITHPELSKEWNLRKNGNLNPLNVKFDYYDDVWWICKDGHEWKTKIKYRTVFGKGCPDCKHNEIISKRLGNTHPHLNEEWHTVLNGELTPFDVTYGSGKKVWWKCSICNHEWRATIVDRTKVGTNCPQCSESKGERKVREYLIKHNIIFIPQYEINGLIGIGGRLLKFDFAILFEEKLLFLIEYDGLFHFGKVYDGDSHEITEDHDQRKNNYCKKNNIHLLRIPYWDFDNIEDILTKELINYGIF